MSSLKTVDVAADYCECESGNALRSCTAAKHRAASLEPVAASGSLEIELRATDYRQFAFHRSVVMFQGNQGALGVKWQSRPEGAAV